jgi:hypothetical protein
MDQVVIDISINYIYMYIFLYGMHLTYRLESLTRSDLYLCPRRNTILIGRTPELWRDCVYERVDLWAAMYLSALNSRFLLLSLSQLELWYDTCLYSDLDLAHRLIYLAKFGSPEIFIDWWGLGSNIHFL